jgi:hypothetical protein
LLEQRERIEEDHMPRNIPPAPRDTNTNATSSPEAEAPADRGEGKIAPRTPRKAEGDEATSDEGSAGDVSSAAPSHGSSESRDAG